MKSAWERAGRNRHGYRLPISLKERARSETRRGLVLVFLMPRRVRRQELVNLNRGKRAPQVQDAVPTTCKGMQSRLLHINVRICVRNRNAFLSGANQTIYAVTP